MKTIVLAGGCFWGVQHYFKQMRGVLQCTAGYTGGSVADPSYEQVYTDTTGHAEAVRVTYDEALLPTETLLRRYLCSIDPLSENRQGNDVGTRYRTGIFYTDPADAAPVRRMLDALGAELGAAPCVQVAPLETFYPAEDFHQDYLDRNPGGYCHLPLKLMRYPRVMEEIRSLLEGEADGVAAMAEVACLLQERMGFFWTGFYRVSGEELVLGPFQGPVACLRIGYGKGVCGSAWAQGRTLVVPDVEAFPGHIACSAESRSEIVVPVFGADGAVSAVLDIDSREPAAFDRADRHWLEEIVKLIPVSC